MAILVTRPEPDNEATAAALRARGVAVLLAPMLRFEPRPLAIGDAERFCGVILTSANALRALGPADRAALSGLPAFAVGARTAEAARDAGFRNVRSADGDAIALRALICKTARRSETRPLLYLCAEDVSRDLSSELAGDGVAVVAEAAYRMAMVRSLPRDAIAALAAREVEMVLHYSRRSARAFVEAARADGVEIAALSALQLCLSPAVAEVLREAGAAQVRVADAPNEAELLALVDRAKAQPAR